VVTKWPPAPAPANCLPLQAGRQLIVSADTALAPAHLAGGGSMLSPVQPTSG